MRKYKFRVYKFNKAIIVKILNLTIMKRFIKQLSNDLVHKLFCERNSTIESIDKSDIKSDRLKPHSFLAEEFDHNLVFSLDPNLSLLYILCLLFL